VPPPLFAWLLRSLRAIFAPSSLVLLPFAEHTILWKTNFLSRLVLYLPIERSVLFLSCPVSCWDPWAVHIALYYPAEERLFCAGEKTC